MATGLVLAAAFSRILPHPYNFTPIGGMALFAGAVFSRHAYSWAIPFLALWISDLVLNNTIYSSFYTGFQWMGHPGTILGFALIFLLGRAARGGWQPLRLAGLSLGGSLVFFLVSNFTCWAAPASLYSKDAPGLLACYAAGLPFFGGTLVGDLFYNTVLFGGWYLLSQRQPQLQTV